MGGITNQIGNERPSNCGDLKRYKYQDHVVDLPIPQILDERLGN